MIESRYKIEYVLPQVKQKKSIKSRALAYLLLLPLILTVVGVISYNFVFQDISKDSITLLHKIKEQVLDLNATDNSNSKPIITEESNSDISNTAIHAVELPKDIVIETTKAVLEANPKGQIEEIIKELSTKQLEQYDTIKSHLTKNAELTRKLNNLSEKLNAEIKKNKTLNQQLTIQEEDKKNLTELLDTLEKSESEGENSISLLDQTDKEKQLPNSEHSVIKTIPENNLSIKDSDTGETVTEISENLSVETAEKPINNKDIPKPVVESINDNSTPKQTKTSQVDAIVAAMKGIQTNSKSSSQ